MVNSKRSSEKMIGVLIPSLNYPTTAPAFLTATLSNNNKNHLYPLVTKLRDKLEQYINDFNRELKKNLIMDEFDNKFL